MGSTHTGAEAGRCSVCMAHQVLSFGVWVTEGNTTREPELSSVAITFTTLCAKPPAQWCGYVTFKKEKLVFVCAYLYWKDCNHQKLPRIDS